MKDLRFLADRLRVAPFHQWLDLRLVSADGDGVAIEMAWRSEIVSRSEPPIMHGGVVSALIDVAGLYAVLAAGGAASGTAYLHVDFHRAVPPGPVTVRGRAVKLGRRISISEAEVICGENEIFASGRGGYFA